MLSCKNGSDIIATINGGEITRLEFNDWLESRKIPAGSVYKDKYAMSDYLRLLAVEKLTAEKALKSGFGDEKNYRIIENTLYKNLLATRLTDKKKEEITFSETGYDISIIRLFSKNETVKEHSLEKENKNKLMIFLLSELAAGKDFNELAGKYSEDAASRKKGRLGIVPESVMDDGIKNSVIKLKENEYTKEPVILGKSICLVKLHKRYELNEKNIKSIITEKENEERVIEYYKNKFIDEMLKNIQKEKNIVPDINKTSFRNNTVIFSIGAENFTSSELDAILKLFYSLKNGIPSDGNFPDEEKIITSQKIFKERLLASEAQKILLEEDPSFKRDWFYLKRATLAGAYKFNILSKGIKIKDADIRNEYERNKTIRYIKIQNKNNKEIKIILTFNEAKPIIINQLNRENLKLSRKKWDNEILAEGNFKIINKGFLIN